MPNLTSHERSRGVSRLDARCNDDEKLTRCANHQSNRTLETPHVSDAVATPQHIVQSRDNDRQGANATRQASVMADGWEPVDAERTGERHPNQCATA